MATYSSCRSTLDAKIDHDNCEIMQQFYIDNICAVCNKVCIYFVDGSMFQIDITITNLYLMWVW